MELSLLNLMLVLAAALAGGTIASRLGYPAILGELLAGIVVGPSLLGLIEPDPGLAVLGEVGILLMMLYIGVHLDIADLKRASWPGFLAASGGFLVPAGLGYVAATWFGASAIAAIFVGLAMGVTSLATKSRILVDLKILDTRIAHVLIAGALASDMAVLVVFAGVVGVAGVVGTVSSAAVAFDLAIIVGKVIVFVVVAYVVGTRGLPAAGRLLARSGISDTSLIFLMLVLTGLVFAEFAELAGLHAILGAFVAGLFVDTDVLHRRVAKDVQHLLRTVSIGLLAPVFFVTAGFHVTLDVFRTDLAFLVTVVLLATLGKILGTALFYLPSGNGWREGVAVGAGMNGRGAVEIVVAEIALGQGLIGPEVFSILVVMALATTATVPVLLTMSIRWLERRGELVRPKRRHNVIIVGAGPVAQRLAAALGPTPVRMIDTNPDHAESARAAGLDVVVGSALDEHVLSRAGAADAGGFVAMTPNSHVNVLAAQLVASAFATPHIHVVAGSRISPGLEELIVDAGASQLFDRSIDLESWDHDVQRGAACEAVIDVDGDPSGDDTQDVALSGVSAGGAALPLVVIRDSEHLLFASAGDLVVGDKVVVLVRRSLPSQQVVQSAVDHAEQSELRPPLPV